MIKIAPSILSADFARMGDAVERLSDWGADFSKVNVTVSPSDAQQTVPCLSVR